jgi:hypothetical protein
LLYNARTNAISLLGTCGTRSDVIRYKALTITHLQDAPVPIPWLPNIARRPIKSPGPHHIRILRPMRIHEHCDVASKYYKVTL